MNTIRSIIVAGLAGLAMIQAAHADDQSQARANGHEAGEKAFATLHCALCHSVSAANIESSSPALSGPDLSGYQGSDVSKLHQYLTGASRIDGGSHPPVSRLDDSDTAAIAAWLASLKDEPCGE